MDNKFLKEVSKAFHGAAGYASSAIASNIVSPVKKGVKKVAKFVDNQIEGALARDKAEQDYKRDRNVKMMLKNGMSINEINKMKK